LDADEGLPCAHCGLPLHLTHGRGHRRARDISVILVGLCLAALAYGGEGMGKVLLGFGALLAGMGLYYFVYTFLLFRLAAFEPIPPVREVAAADDTPGCKDCDTRW
jgi:hypothetical protein